MIHCTAAEGQKFQNEIIRVSEIISKLGSNPLKKSKSNEKSQKNSQKGKNKS
jgi:hypothetical protein